MIMRSNKREAQKMLDCLKVQLAKNGKANFKVEFENDDSADKYFSWCEASTKKVWRFKRIIAIELVADSIYSTSVLNLLDEHFHEYLDDVLQVAIG